MNLRVHITNGNGNGHSNGNGSGSKGRTHEPDLTSYRRIALQLHYDLPRPDSARSVLVVTPAASTFSGYGSAALATCLAQELCKPVLLVDAFPGSPLVAPLLDCPSSPGLGDMIFDPNLTMDRLTLPTSHRFLRFLPAGNAAGVSSQAPEHAASTLLKSAGSQYDFVVLSGGSVLNNHFGMAIVPQVGCVLLLVIENETTIEDLDAAQNALTLGRARKVGLVLTTPVKGQGALELSASAGSQTD